MKVVLDIQDSKVDYILDLLRQFAYVKIKDQKKVKKEAINNQDNAMAINKKKKSPTKPNKIQELLLKGPVMTDEQYHDFLEKRKHFNAWK